MSRYATAEYRRKHAEYARAWRKKHGNGKRNQDAQLRWRISNPEKYKRAQANSKLKKYYGITIDEREQLLAEQGDVCAICKSARGRWHVDHCHRSKRVRGVLCHWCNALLGYANDDVAILINAVAYLRSEEVPISCSGNHRGPASIDRIRWLP